MTDEDKIVLTILTLTLGNKLRKDCPYGMDEWERHEHDELSGRVFHTHTNGKEYLYFTPCKKHLKFYDNPSWREVDLGGII